MQSMKHRHKKQRHHAKCPLKPYIIPMQFTPKHTHTHESDDSYQHWSHHLAFLFVVGILFSCSTMVSSQCDYQALKVSLPYVQKVGPKARPSQGCCAPIGRADIPYICQHISSVMENLINMHKVRSLCLRGLQQTS